MLLVVIVLGIMGWAALFLYWGSDRTSPFSMQSYESTGAAPGGTMYVKANVTRDLSRGCAVAYTREFVDNGGFRHEPKGAELTAAAWADLDKMNPGKLSFAVPVPQGAAAGWGVVVVQQRYECNPLHNWYPIPDTVKFNVEVLPAPPPRYTPW